MPNARLPRWFEHSSQPVISTTEFAYRVARQAAVAQVLVAFSLVLGMIGFRLTEGMGWLDGFLESAMLLGGMGPVHPPVTPAGKLFDVLLALALLAGCSGEAGPTAVTTRDSAGVTIIEHPAAAVAAAPVWTLGPAKVTIDHGATDEELFARVTEAARLSDGRIVVINAEDEGAQPLLYRADGTFERPLGRQGSGPGEFRTASLLDCRAGDTLCLFDFNTRRITRMLPTGDVATIIDLSRVGQMALGFPRGVLPDGRLVSLPFMFDTVSSGGAVFRTPNVIVTVDPAVGDPDTVATGIPGAATYLGTVTFGDRSMTFPMPAGSGAPTMVSVAGAR